MYWVEIKLAQQKGFKFYQTRSKAIIFCITLPANCILKGIMMAGEIMHEKVYASPRAPPKISFEDNWMEELDSEVARSGEDSQQIQPKSKTQLSRTVRLFNSEQPSGSITQGIDRGVLFGFESTNVRTVRLVNSCVPVSVERVDKDKDADENVDADPIRTVRLVRSGQSIDLFTQLEEMDIDFRVCGLPHAVVKQAENFSVRELVKKIESHPHREALQADLQQNNVYNPFSDNSRAMIRDMGNVELFELCETIPEVQCSECLLYWNQGVIYCTCGHLLVESESSQNFHQWRLDAFSIPHYVIKKVRPRGARHGKAESQEEHFVVHNARKRCIKKEFWWNSRSFPTRFSTSWFATQNWLDRGEVHRDGEIGKGSPLLLPILWGVWEIKENGIYITEQAEMHRWNSDQTTEQQSQRWTVYTENPEKNDLNQFTFINTKGGFDVFFNQYLMMAVEWKLVELIFLCCSKIVAADGNLLEPTGVWTEHLRTSHFLVFARMCNDVSHDIGSRCQCASYRTILCFFAIIAKLRLDALSIPHFGIKKERPHGARHGETEAQKQYHVAFNAWKRCRKRVDCQEEHYEGIHDWTEQKCIEMDKFAQEDHSYRLSGDEFQRYQKHWYLTFSKSGKNASRWNSDLTSEPQSQSWTESGEERPAFATVPKMAPFFLKWCLVEFGHGQSRWSSWVQFIFSKKKKCCSSFRWQLIATVICTVTHLCDLTVCFLLIPHLVLSVCFSSFFWTCTSSSMWTSSGQYPTGTPPTEESGPFGRKRTSYNNSFYGRNLGQFPHSLEIQSWKVNFRTEVCPLTADSQITWLWIKEVEIAKSIDELKHRDRLWGMITLISICLMRWLRQPWRNFSTRSQISWKE